MIISLLGKLPSITSKERMTPMRKSKLMLILALTAFISIVPSLSLAAQADATSTPTPTAIEMEMQRLHDTWQNLPKRQKDQLYKAREAVDKADCNFIDKAVDCGLLDKQIGERMKEHIKARTARIKEDGDIPMFRRGVKSKQQ